MRENRNRNAHGKPISREALPDETVATYLQFSAVHGECR
jgi:hypothetical protein